MESVKIQINSLEALERLIGGEAELEIELRHSVAAAFAKRYLGSAISEEVKDQVDRKIKLEVQEAFLKKIQGYSNTFELKSDVKDMITEELNLKGRSLIGEIVAESLTKKHIIIKEVEDKMKTNLEQVDKAISIAATRIANDLSEIVLTKRIDALVDVRIKEKLGL